MYEKEIIFLGAKQSGFLALKEIIKRKIKVVLVIVKDNNDSIKLISFAKKNNLKILKVNSLKNLKIYTLIRKLNIVTAISVSFPLILPLKFLKLFKNGVFNVHYADLPFYRGLYPTIRPIINLERYAYITVHKMDRGIDSGPILLKHRIIIKKKHTGWSLYQDMVNKIPTIINSSLKKIFSKNKEFFLNDEKLSNYYNSIPNDGVINWSWDGKYIINFIRALSNKDDTGAIGKIGDKKLYIKEAIFKKIKIKKPFEEIQTNNRLFCFCKDGIIIIKKAFIIDC